MPNETPGAVCSQQRLYKLLKFVAAACFLVVIIAIVSVLIHSTPDTRTDDASRVSLINTISSQESSAVVADDNDTYYNNNITGITSYTVSVLLRHKLAYYYVLRDKMFSSLLGICYKLTTVHTTVLF